MSGVEHLPDWAKQPRWNGEAPSKPWSAQRTRTMAQLRSSENPIAPPALCMSGKELLVLAARGVYAFPLEANRRHCRGPELPGELAAALTRVHLVALGWIATAVAVFARAGVIASHAELGELLGRSARRTGDTMRELVRLELLYGQATFRPVGCVTAQRACLYVLSQRAVDLYRLVPWDRARQVGQNVQPTAETSGSGSDPDQDLSAGVVPDRLDETLASSEAPEGEDRELEAMRRAAWQARRARGTGGGT